MSSAPQFGNPYASVLNPSNRTYLFHQWARTGFRRGLANYPWFVDAKSGDIIITERDSHRIQIFDCVGNETRFEPFGRMGHGHNQFCYPGGLTTTNITGANVIVADTGNSRVTYYGISSDDHGYGVLNQNQTFGHQIFRNPTGLELDVNRMVLIVADNGTNRVSIHDMRDGQIRGEFRPRQTKPLLSPTDVAINEHGHSYVTDANGHCVQVFDTNGDYMFHFGSYGCGEGQFSKPWGICFDRQFNLLVSDEGNNRIQMFRPDGMFVRMIATEIPQPKGMTVNIHENLVVTTGDPYDFIKILKYK